MSSLDPPPATPAIVPSISPAPTEDATATALIAARQAAAAIASPAAAEATAPPPSAPRLHEVSRRSPFGALLSRTLPAYGGEYSVGVCDMEVAVAPRTFGNFAHKSMRDKPAGLSLDTVLFSLFYPCEPQGKITPVVWFPAYVLLSWTLGRDR
jgi:hypothetical protein